MKNILITRTDRLGDVILSTPALRAVREGYPDSRITVITTPYTKDCVEGNPYINDVLVYDKNGKQNGVINSFKFAMELKKRKFDIAFILHPTNRMNLITFLAGIPRRIGYDRRMGFLLTQRVRHDKQSGEKHEIDYTLDLVRAAGLTPVSKVLYMPLKRDVRRKISGILSAAGVDPSDRLIAIHPSSSCPSKKWPVERFAGITDRLIDRYNVKAVIISGPSGIQDAERMAGSMTHDVINMSGKTSIPELGALLKRCELFISNDSGPVHVACAVGTPVVAIFGRKDLALGPKRWGPSGLNDIILHKNTECVQCLAHNCKKEFLCLKAVSADDVMDASDVILKGRGGDHDKDNVLQGKKRDNYLYSKS